MSRDRSLRVIQGTLDLLILRTLVLTPLHGHGIAKHIQRTSEDAFLVDHGALSPALRRLENNGHIASQWEMTRGRDMRMYRVTPKGRKQLAAEETKWNALVVAMTRVLKPV